MKIIPVARVMPQYNNNNNNNNNYNYYYYYYCCCCCCYIATGWETGVRVRGGARILSLKIVETGS